MSGTITHIRGPVAAVNSLTAQSIAHNAHSQGFTVIGNSAFCSLYDGSPWAPTLIHDDIVESPSNPQIDQRSIVIFDQLDLALIVMESLRSREMRGQQALLMHQLDNQGAHLVLVYQSESSVDPAVLPKSNALIEMRGLSAPPFLLAVEQEVKNKEIA